MNDSDQSKAEDAHGTDCEECGSSWKYRSTILGANNPEYCPFCGAETGPQLKNWRGSA